MDTSMGKHDLASAEPVTGEARAEQVLDLYKFAVEMADRISARRGAANQFFLSLETLILGAPALFALLGDGAELDDGRATFLAAIGVLVAIVWWLQLRSYRALNRAKFEVILAIERDELALRIFTDEWSHLKTDPVKRWQGRYAELGAIERLVPWVFIVMNLTLLLWTWT